MFIDAFHGGTRLHLTCPTHAVKCNGFQAAHCFDVHSGGAVLRYQLVSSIPLNSSLVSQLVYNLFSKFLAPFNEYLRIHNTPQVVYIFFCGLPHPSQLSLR